jgi:hypothetical protein
MYSRLTLISAGQRVSLQIQTTAKREHWLFEKPLLSFRAKPSHFEVRPFARRFRFFGNQNCERRADKFVRVSNLSSVDYLWLLALRI